MIVADSGNDDDDDEDDQDGEGEGELMIGLTPMPTQQEDDDEEEPRPPPTAAKRLPSDSESPFGTLNSEGRVRAAISRLGILDDNGDVPKMRNF